MRLFLLIVIAVTLGACQVKPSTTIQGAPSKNVKVYTTITPNSVSPRAILKLGL